MSVDTEKYKSRFKQIERKRKLNVWAIFFGKAIPLTLLLGPIYMALFEGELGAGFLMSYIITGVFIYKGLKRSQRARMFPLEKLAILGKFFESINSSLKYRGNKIQEYSKNKKSAGGNLHLAYYKFEEDEHPSTSIYNIFTGITGNTKYRFFDILIGRTKSYYQSRDSYVYKIDSIEKVAVLTNDDWDFRTAYLLPNKPSKFHKEKLFGFQRPIDKENYPILSKDFKIYSNDKQILNYLEGLNESILPFVSNWNNQVAFGFHKKKIYIAFLANPKKLMKLNLMRSNRNGKSVIRIYQEMEEFIEQLKKLQGAMKPSQEKINTAGVPVSK